jgi:hypothetical protein
VGACLINYSSVWSVVYRPAGYTSTSTLSTRRSGEVAYENILRAQNSPVRSVPISSSCHAERHPGQAGMLASKICPGRFCRSSSNTSHAITSLEGALRVHLVAMTDSGTRRNQSHPPKRKLTLGYHPPHGPTIDLHRRRPKATVASSLVSLCGLLAYMVLVSLPSASEHQWWELNGSARGRRVRLEGVFWWR